MHASRAGLRHVASASDMQLCCRLTGVDRETVMSTCDPLTSQIL